MVSAVLASDKKASILEKLTGVKTDLGEGAIITLNLQDKRLYIKVGNTYIPFINIGYNVIQQHPKIMPGTFSIQEYKNDVLYGRDLGEILGVLHELTKVIEETYFAVNSDAMSETLEVYAAVQNNVGKVSGMDAYASDMKAFFRKSKPSKPGTNTDTN